jgi:hypothetical protein
MTAIYHDLGHLVARDPAFIRRAAKAIDDKIVGVESQSYRLF